MSNFSYGINILVIKGKGTSSLWSQFGVKLCVSTPYFYVEMCSTGWTNAPLRQDTDEITFKQLQKIAFIFFICVFYDVTQPDRPKSVHNRYVIEVFGGVFVLSRCFLDFSVGVGAFVIGLSQIVFFFSFCTILMLRWH